MMAEHFIGPKPGYCLFLPPLETKLMEQLLIYCPFHQLKLTIINTLNFVLLPVVTLSFYCEGQVG